MEELHIIPRMEVQHPLKKMFVNENIAKVLKENGFNEPCFAYYRLNHVNDDYMFHIVGEYSGSSSDWYVNYVGTGLTNNEMQRNPIGRLRQCFTAPLYQQVIDWFRNKHKISIWIEKYDDSQYQIPQCPQVKSLSIIKYTEDYYEALEAAIIEALKLIKA